MVKLECRRARQVIAPGHETIRDVRQVNLLDFTGRFPIVPAKRIARNLEKPGVEQSAVAKLIGFLVHRQHHFLRQIFTQVDFASARTEESY
jgi:hypothetical protein